MSYGLEILNDAGSVQIGTSTANFYLAQKGSFILSAGFGYDAFIEHTVTPTVSYDGIAIAVEAASALAAGHKPTLELKSLFATTKAANTPTTFWSVYAWDGAGSIPPDVTIRWYAFRNYKYLPLNSSGYGLDIFNTDGTLAFTSQNPYLLKGTKVPITASHISSSSGIALPSGKTYAFMTYGTTIISNYLSPYWYNYYLSHSYNQTSKIFYPTPHQFTNLPVTTTNQSTYNGGVLAIDVTSY